MSIARKTTSKRQRSGLPAGMTLCLCLVLPGFFIACPKSDKGPNNARVGISRSEPPTPPVASAVGFNGERAMTHARKQVEFGPRPPGSPELAKTREYIITELKSYGLVVSTDEFKAKTPKGEKKMVNITAEVPGELTDVIIIASHYETKYYEDMYFVGANDPAASVGTLVELGRVLAAKQERPKFTFWLVFFDGEEALCEGWDDCGTPEEPDNTYGSRHYVSELRNRNELNRIGAMVLLDLIGYKNLELRRDTMSTKWLVDTIWQTGRELSYDDIFLNESEDVGGDDHVPFLRAGIDAVDIIQLSSYPYWHRADDTLDKISPRSMKIVGDVVLASLPKIEQRLLKKR